MDERPVVIDLKNVKKKYVIRHNAAKPDTFKGRLKLMGKNLLHPTKKYQKEDFWALDGITFQVKQGEKIGIIGKNGAGKSTLLKILSRITEPTDGRIEIWGKVSAMLEVGTGFNGELTGRENIYLNGAILGMTKGEIDSKFDEIVAFSEVGKFIDTPVKRYSSGMFVRLAFAVASHLEPDILIVDEVLAVGDTKFQRKCIARMMNIADGGKTILYVSHQMHTIRQLCDRVIVLKNGKVVFDGDVEKGIEAYTETADVSTNKFIDLEGHKERGTQQVVFKSAELIDREKYEWAYYEPIKFRVKIKAKEDCDGVFFSTVIRNLNIDPIASGDSMPLGRFESGKEYEFDVSIHNENIIAPDKYVIGIEMWKKTNEISMAYDIIPQLFSCEIFDSDPEDESDARTISWHSNISGNTMIQNVEAQRTL